MNLLEIILEAKKRIEEINERAEKTANDILFSNINFFVRHKDHNIVTAIRANHLACMSFHKCPECLEYIIVVEKRPTLETLNPNKEETGC